ncbi:FUSC family protein [Sphingobacterium sp. SRCM116780]|uniref:FUSC family membrane protein n=1 Tax=Sphingobacterium sp. SRCM116780 TaxID=2907623 RepID=UPI001F3632DB|nr:FUSC family membrane protein [Sphingobacterium sp. SRCM116780]UIR56830.1 FUSC family protein [Sphingobacterium sp. SRCM116780]
MFKLIEKLWQKTRFFINSQPFHEGLKITIAVLIPVLIFACFNQLHYGVTVGIGVIIASTPDLVGPYRERRKSMLVNVFLIFTMSMLTRILPFSDLSLGLFIAFSSFAACMLTAYGIRAMGIGASCLLTLFFSLTLTHEHSHPILEALLMTAGAIWYMLFVLLVRFIRPYRVSQQVLAECAYEIGNLLRVKADFFNSNMAIAKTHKRVIQVNVLLNQHQESVREILFSAATDKQFASSQYRQLTFIFANTMELFERINASHHDYYRIRDQYGDTKAYQLIPGLLISCAQEMERLSTSISVLKAPKSEIQFTGQWDRAYVAVIALEQEEGEAALVLKKILVNIRYVMQKIREIHRVLSKSAKLDDHSNLLAHKEKFFKQRKFSWLQLQAHLNFHSPIFRHSLRVAIVMLIAYVITKILPLVFPEYAALTQHSFWIYITILVILRPGFSLSKQRSIDRLKGSFLGGLLALLNIFFITNTYVLLGLTLIYMLLAFTFLRGKYVYGSFFITACFLIIYYFFTGVDDFGIVLLKERLLDTIIGCILAFLSFYFILPTWESNSIKPYLKEVIKANIHFLSISFCKFSGNEIELADYKLARKEIYLSLAELNALNERILSEPRHQRPFTKELNDFSIYTHLLISYAMAFTNMMGQGSALLYNQDQYRLMDQILSQLKKCYGLFSTEPYAIIFPNRDTNQEQSSAVMTSDIALIGEQLELMLDVVDKLYHNSLDISLLVKRSL